MKLQREARRAWEALLARVPHDRADERGVVYADLSVKDVVAHLAAWEWRAPAQLRALTLGQIVEDTPAGVSWEEFERSFNESVRDAWRGRSWPEVQREAHAAYADFIAAAEAAPDDLLFRAQAPAWRIVAFNGYLHYARGAGTERPPRAPRGRGWGPCARSAGLASPSGAGLADATTATKCDERSEYEDFLRPVRDWLERRS